MASYADSYVGQLRQLVGNRRLITPGARAIIRDEHGHVLCIRRSDNGQWGLPAGSLELGESILDCLEREVREETGLIVTQATAIAIYSAPRFAFTNAFGGEHQMFALVFRVDAWHGTLTTRTDETIDARFFPPDQLPDLPPHHLETLDDLRQFDGHLIVK